MEMEASVCQDRVDAGRADALATFNLRDFFADRKARADFKTFDKNQDPTRRNVAWGGGWDKLPQESGVLAALLSRLYGLNGRSFMLWPQPERDQRKRIDLSRSVQVLSRLKLF
jgi:hypothetical protein